MNQVEIVLIYGSPRTGKTTLGKALLQWEPVRAHLVDNYQPEPAVAAPGQPTREQFNALLVQHERVYVIAEKRCKPFGLPPARYIRLTQAQ